MGTQKGNAKKSLSRQQRRRYQLFGGLTIIIGASFLFALLLSSVNYSSKCEALSAKSTSLLQKIDEIESEIQYLEMEAERYRSRKVVFWNIKRFNLGLRPAKPYQVRNLYKPTVEERRIAGQRYSNSARVAAHQTPSTIVEN